MVDTGYFIRGKWDGKAWGAGPFYFRFRITERQTAYEWAMALADRHPYASFLSVWFGDMKAQTKAGMRARRKALAILSPLADALYRELEEEYEAGRLVLLKRAYCADNPDALDFTNCMFGIGPVLDLVRRRGDRGWLINKLLKACESIATDETPQKFTPVEPASIERLAEWIYARHGERHTFDQLYEAAARDSEISGVRKTDLQIAYRQVYDSSPHRPPASGWSLRQPYSERWNKEHQRSTPQKSRKPF
jgi:hypothetical protein